MSCPFTLRPVFLILLSFLFLIHLPKDLLSEVYEVPCIVQRDKVSCNSTLASLCVVALTLPVSSLEVPFSWTDACLFCGHLPFFSVLTLSTVIADEIWKNTGMCTNSPAADVVFVTK